MPRFFLLVLLLLLCACEPLPALEPVAVPPDWVQVGEHRLPAQVFLSSQDAASVGEIAWEQPPVVFVWEGGWPQYHEFWLPAGLGPVDLAFLDVGSRTQEVFPQVSCPEWRVAGCTIRAKHPAAFVLVFQEGRAAQIGLRQSTLVEIERSDRVSEVEVLGVGI